MSFNNIQLLLKDFPNCVCGGQLCNLFFLLEQREKQLLSFPSLKRAVKQSSTHIPPYSRGSEHGPL